MKHHGLMVTLDEKGEPIKITMDGDRIAATKLCVSYRANTPPIIELEFHEEDCGVVCKDNAGKPVFGQRTFYAVSKEDFDLLQTVKK